MRQAARIGVGSGFAAAAVAMVIVAGASGDDDRVVASDALKRQYPALAVPQEDRDRVVASTPEGSASAHRISESSRLVASGSVGNVFAFVSGEGEACVLIQDARREVGGTGCVDPDGASESPGVVIYRQEDPQIATVASLVRSGASPVEIQHEGGRSEVLESGRGGFVYSGRTPFTAVWSDDAGSHKLDVTSGPDVTKLKRAPASPAAP